MIKMPLNRTEAAELFSENAVLIGRTDVIERDTAVNLLGQDAYKYAVCHAKTRAENGYGIGHYTLNYMTEEAFYLGITYLNIESYRIKKQAAADK